MLLSIDIPFSVTLLSPHPPWSLLSLTETISVVLRLYNIAKHRLTVHFQLVWISTTSLFVFHLFVLTWATWIHWTLGRTRLFDWWLCCGAPGWTCSVAWNRIRAQTLLQYVATRLAASSTCNEKATDADCCWILHLLFCPSKPKTLLEVDLLYLTCLLHDRWKTSLKKKKRV